VNLICPGGLVVGHALARELLKIFLTVRFSGAERHRRRLSEVAELESREAATADHIGRTPMQPTQVLDADGQPVGTYQRSVDTPDGEMMLIAREERLGGGTIVVPAREAGEPDDAWHLPYGGLSIREAPPYSPNVDLRAYFEFWEQLGVSNFNSSADEYVPTGSGPVQSDVDVPDDRLQEAVIAALRDAGGCVNHRLARVSVKRGTVLLEGYQNDIPGRLAAAEAAASVPGVKEIINMLMIRAV